jgi:hypothetical protein
MKPTSPEEREIEQAAAEVSARYREAANDEPSARLDAAILQAAREQAGRGRVGRHWRVPAAVAAVVVVGVSLSFMTREVIEPLPPMEQKQGADRLADAPASAEMAKPAPPSLAMKSDAAPAAREKRDVGSRPSRDRGERADREAEPRLAPAPDAVGGSAAEAPASQAAPVAPPAPPAPAGAAPEAEVSARRQASAASEAAGQDKAYEPQAGARDSLEAKKAAPVQEARRAQALRKEEASGFASGNAAPASAEEGIREIEALVAQGRRADAKARLAEFRKRYPDYRLPEALRALEAAPADVRR